MMTTDEHVADAIKRVQAICHGASVTAGWWKLGDVELDKLIRDPQTPWDRYVAGALVAQKLCLAHSEVSEAMEGHRRGLMDDKLPHRPMIEVEIADAIIRLLDLAGALRLDVGGAVVEKMAYNRQRKDHKAEVRALAGGKAY